MYTKTHCNSKIYISGDTFCTRDFPDCMNLFDTVIMVYKEDMNIQDEEGRTPLYKAGGDSRFALKIREAGGDFGQSQCGASEVSYNSKALIAASTLGDETEVRTLLKTGQFVVNATDSKGQTSLMKAAEKGNTDTVKTLLEHRADVNTIDNYGGTSLMNAAMYGNTHIVKILLEHGADVNHKDYNGQTSLMATAYKGNSETARILLEHGADVNHIDNDGKTAVDHALRYNPMDEERERLKERFKIAVILKESGAKWGDKIFFINESLIRASFSGDADVVKILLKLGADVNYKENDGMTFLHNAIGMGNTEVVKTLLELGADVNLKDNFFGMTSLIYAELFGKTEIVKILLEHEADVNTKDSEGGTSLMDAAGSGQTEILKIRLEHEADNDGESRYLGWTSFINTAIYRITEIMKILIEHGADVNTKKHDGWTSLIYAVLNGNTNTVKILLEHGADINHKDNNRGWTSLMAAAGYGKTEALKILLEHGAEINCKDNDGETALDYALTESFLYSEERIKAKREIAEILRKHGGKRGGEIE